ncbi:MAG: dUTP diphosphatase [Cetobacterium sp.]
MKKGISDFCGLKNVLSEVSETSISFYGTNSVDFLSKIYDSSDETLRKQENYNLYLTQIFNCRPRCKFTKTRTDAIPPTKLRCSDEGYDLWIVDIDKKISDNTTRYDTFLKIQPEDGWHVEILPRSSLSNSGYILSNCVGLIDSSYRGTLKIALTKIDETADDIKLPFKGVQMVLRQNVHFICEEVEELDATERGEGGFGSTDLL